MLSHRILLPQNILQYLISMKNEVIKAHILYVAQELSFSPLVLTQTAHYSEKAGITQWEIHIQTLTSASSRPEAEDIQPAHGIRMWRCPCWQCRSCWLTWKCLWCSVQCDAHPDIPVRGNYPGTTERDASPLLTLLHPALLTLIETVIYWSTRRVKTQPTSSSNLRKQQG